MFFKKKKGVQKAKKSPLESARDIGFAVFIALSIRWLLLEAYVIPSGSMLPSLLINDHIFVNKIVYGIRVPFQKTWLVKFKEPERGEIIVFKWPREESTFFIKRVIGVPGDTIFYDNGDLFVNGNKVEKTPAIEKSDMDYVSEEQLPGGKQDYVHYIESLDNKDFQILLRRGYSHISSGPLVVGEDEYFVMGDNRDNSNDSRVWGIVPRENLLGRAMFVWLSCENVVVRMLCDPSTIRFRRFFHQVQ